MAGNLARSGPCAACLSTALIPVTLVTASRRLARGKGIVVRLGVATLSLSFLLLAGASVHAQAPPPAPPEASRPTPGIAQSFVNWLHHVAGIAPHRRERSMPPLPRPRPAELAATSDAPDNAPAAQLHSLGAQKPTAPVIRLSHSVVPVGALRRGRTGPNAAHLGYRLASACLGYQQNSWR